MARHAWATLCFHMGTPVGIISEVLGHSFIRVAETYLKPFANERVDKANDKLITSIVRSRKEKSNKGRVLQYSELQGKLLTK